MTNIKFPMQYETSVFINGNMAISITQDSFGSSEMVVFYSKKRAVEVARAILNLAKIATFDPDKEADEQ